VNHHLSLSLPRLQHNPQQANRVTQTFLHFFTLRTGILLILLTQLVNKVTAVYGILALLTAYPLSPLQLSMYVYSLALLAATLYLIAGVRKQEPWAALAFAQTYALDTLINGVYTAAFSAAWLAFTHGFDHDIQAFLRTADGPNGFAAMSVLADYAAQRGERTAIRAVALVRAGRRSVIDTMLAAGDPLTSVRASVALAARGDAEALSVALEASRVVETKWLVMTTHPHEQMARAAIDYLNDGITEPRMLPKSLEHTEELPVSLFAPLIRLYARSADDKTAKQLITAFVHHRDAISWFNHEDENVGTVVPSRLDSWFIAQGLAETDPKRAKVYTSVYVSMVHKQRNDSCRPNAPEGTLAQWAEACPLPVR
jgi:hypothetical protein